MNARKTARSAPQPDEPIAHFLAAEQNGIGKHFQILYDAAMRHGLYPKRYLRSLMYAPQRNKNRVLICVWTHAKKGKLIVYVASNAFAEFFPVTLDDVRELIGAPGYAFFDLQETLSFEQQLDQLFALIARNSR